MPAVTVQIKFTAPSLIDDFRSTNGFGFASTGLKLGAGVFAYQNFNPPNAGTFEAVQPIRRRRRSRAIRGHSLVTRPVSLGR